MPGWGIDPREIDQILSPLNELLSQLVGQQIGGRRRKFVYTLVLDAHRTTIAIRVLLAAKAEGAPLMADAVELLARRIVEQAIVAAYVARTDVSSVDRFLRTGSRSWNRSLHREREGDDPNPSFEDLPVRELPKYRQMAEQVDPELGVTFSMLSFVARPRQAHPYSLLEYAWDQDEYFWLRAGKAIGNLKPPIAHLISAYELVAGEQPET